jgi:hypothetical protein
MPIQVQFSPLHRQVIVVARGDVTMDEFRDVSAKLRDAAVRHYGKIIDVSAARSGITPEEVQRFAASLRGPVGGPVRGPIAFVVDPNAPEHDFPHEFAEATEEDRPIKLFRSLHEARRWLEQTMAEERRSGGSSGPRPSSRAQDS